MAGDFENLFAIGLHDNVHGAVPPTDVLEEAAPTPAHPIAEMQRDYEQAFVLYEKAFEAFEAADRVAPGYTSRISRSSVDYNDMSRCAVRKTVERFVEQVLGGAASLDDDEEFTRATGKCLSDALYGERDRRGHRHHHDDEEQAPVKLNLVELWDSMARVYDDGGVWLARHQAANAIMDEWRLQSQAFEVKNGKALIEHRVYSEPPFYSRPRRVHYNYIQPLTKLCKALDVFFDYADLPGQAMRILWNMGLRGHDIAIESGSTHVVVPGLAQVRTFNEQWKWTLRADVAEKLREFIAAYHPPKK